MSTLILDQFTAANGTSNAGRAPSPTNTPGNTYNVVTGTSSITSNATVFGSADNLTRIQSGVSDCRVSITGTIGGVGVGRSPRIYFRSSALTGAIANPATNLWYVAATATGPAWQLVEVSAGVATVRQTASATITAGSTYAMEVRLSGTTIDLWIDGALMLTFTSSTPQTNTIHGFGCNIAAGVIVDDFMVETVASGVTKRLIGGNLINRSITAGRLVA